MISKASQKCDGLTGFGFKDIGFFLAGTVFIFCIFALVRNVAFGDCQALQMPRMDEKVLNDFILEGAKIIFGKGENEIRNPNFFDLQHPAVVNFFEGIRAFKQQLLELSEKVGSETKITFVE